MSAKTTFASPTTASPEMLRLLAEWERADPTPHQRRMRAASDRRALAADAMRAYLTDAGHGHGAVKLIQGYVWRGDHSVNQQRISQILAKASEVRGDVYRLSAALAGGCLSDADHEAEAHHLAVVYDSGYPAGPDELPGWTQTSGRDWTAPSGTDYTIYPANETRAGRIADHVRFVTITLPAHAAGYPDQGYDVCWMVAR